MSLIAVGNYTDHQSSRIDARGKRGTPLRRGDTGGELIVIGTDSSVRNPGMPPGASSAQYRSWTAATEQLPWFQLMITVKGVETREQLDF